MKHDFSTFSKFGLLAGAIILCLGILVQGGGLSAEIQRDPFAASAGDSQLTLEPKFESTISGNRAANGDYEVLIPLVTNGVGELLAKRYTFDRSNVPTIYFDDVTVKISTGGASDISVTTADGSDVPYRLDAVQNVIVVTTNSAALDVVMRAVPDLTQAGHLEIAALKDDKRWAWSHGFDDNVYLDAGIAEFSQRGLRANLFLIASLLMDDRNEDWIIDPIRLRPLIDAGWSVSNHAWVHECVGANVTVDLVRSGYERVVEVFVSAIRPNYRPISFAAPCFEATYEPIIQQMRDAQDTVVQFNEGKGFYTQVVDSGATQGFGADNIYAGPFDYNTTVGRDHRLEYDVAAVKAEFDWMATHATQTRHFWYNTLVHGKKEQQIKETLDYLVSTYGADGSDEVWIAPSDEIYSYFLTRDRLIVGSSDIRLPDGSHSEIR